MHEHQHGDGEPNLHHPQAGDPVACDAANALWHAEHSHDCRPVKKTEEFAAKQSGLLFNTILPSRINELGRKNPVTSKTVFCVPMPHSANMPPLRTKYLQFRLRMLLWLLAPLCLLLMWVANEYHYVQRRAAFADEFLDSKFSPRCLWLSNYDQFEERKYEMTWLQEKFGNKLLSDLLYLPNLDPDRSQLRVVHKLFPEVRIWTSEKHEGLPDYVSVLGDGEYLMLGTDEAFKIENGAKAPIDRSAFSPFEEN